jgi:hypothetical protein
MNDGFAVRRRDRLVRVNKKLSELAGTRRSVQLGSRCEQICAASRAGMFQGSWQRSRNSWWSG